MIKLYKKDSKGNIRYLAISTSNENLVQESGILNTDKPKIETKACKAKNIGKANETTAIEQAKKQMDALVTKKLQEGYFKTIKSAESSSVLFPMLAKDYKKENHKIKWSSGVFVQPKLDGMRCLMIIANGKVTLKSREGRVIDTLQFINADIEKHGPDFGIFDGELYAHGYSFQENMELIKKYRPGESEDVHFHCYDVVNLFKSFSDRIDEREELKKCKSVVFVETYSIRKENELKKYHKKFLSEGYEGTIIRHGDEAYKPNVRTSYLLKYKDFIDIAAEIIDITPAEQRPEWGVPVLKLKNGKTFRAGVKCSHKERKELLQNKDKTIGKIAEIRFFEYSEDGIPRFPVMVGIRLDKTKSE